MFYFPGNSTECNYKDLETGNLLSQRDETPNRKSSNFGNINLNLLNSPLHEKDESTSFKYETRESHPVNARFIKEIDRVLKRHFQPFIDNINKLQSQREKQKELEAKREIIQNEWRDIAMISDQIICFTFSTLTIITCVFIFSNSPHIFPISEW